MRIASCACTKAGFLLGSHAPNLGRERSGVQWNLVKVFVVCADMQKSICVDEKWSISLLGTVDKEGGRKSRGSKTL